MLDVGACVVDIVLDVGACVVDIVLDVGVCVVDIVLDVGVCVVDIVVVVGPCVVVKEPLFVSSEGSGIPGPTFVSLELSEDPSLGTVVGLDSVVACVLVGTCVEVVVGASVVGASVAGAGDVGASVVGASVAGAGDVGVNPSGFIVLVGTFVLGALGDSVVIGVTLFWTVVDSLVIPLTGVVVASVFPLGVVVVWPCIHSKPGNTKCHSLKTLG